MNVVVIVLAIAGILAGGFAALKADAQVAGAAAILLGFAILLPLVLR